MSEGSQVLGRYSLGERLAAGGMAEIFHASPLEPGRFDCAIVLKRMHEHLAKNRDFVSMFVDEARISSRLEHPNIVRLLDFEATSEGLYIVLEYIDGPDLLALLKGAARRRSTMPQEIVAYIASHVLEALDYAHNAEFRGRRLEVVHRDVSPGNVLLSWQGRVKLADFGIARANDRKKESGEENLKGKFGYMSPEQLEGKDLDGRSDLFSTAVVMAELLMSKRLFSAANELDTLLMVRGADLSRLDKYGKHIDSDLRSILDKALQRKRQDRFESAGSFRDALAEWLSKRPTRTNTRVLKDYIKNLQGGGFIPGRREPGPSSITFSGTNTQALSRRANNAASMGRQMFELGTFSKDDLDLTLGAAGVTGVRSRPTGLREASKVGKPRNAQLALQQGSGKLGDISVIDIIAAVSAEKKKGLLSIGQGPLVKQAYFVDGDPVFVASNDENERFGQFLVRKGLINEEELSKALRTMPHFGGRLGQTLVGLKLLRPVDALHLLAEQVSEKLLRMCGWRDGAFEWKDGIDNPHPAVALHLSSRRIVARGVQTLSDEELADWIAPRHERKPNLLGLSPYDGFGFGPSLRQRLDTMNGTKSIAELLQRANPKSRRILSAALYAVLSCHPHSQK